VVGECANRDCGAPFRYFRDGRLFAFELSGRWPSGGEKTTADHRSVEHFWLCGQCASTLTLILERDRGVVARPLSCNGASLDVRDDELQAIA
jgi:hypothetical protein